MRITVFGFATAEGKPEELSIFMALLVNNLKVIGEQDKDRKIKEEIESIWKKIRSEDTGERKPDEPEQ